VLSSTGITDAGVFHINGLSKAARSGSSGTRITASGIQWLQKALPKAVITAWPCAEEDACLRNEGDARLSADSFPGHIRRIV
jgi:hypothetical protein